MLLDVGLATALLVLRLELTAQALLLGPEALLHHLLLGFCAPLLDAALGIYLLEPPPLFGRKALLGQHLAPELHDANAVPERQPRVEEVGARQGREDLVNHRVLELG